MYSGKTRAKTGEKRNRETAYGLRLLLLLILLQILWGKFNLSAQEYYSGRVTVVEDLIERIARQTDEQLDYQTLFDEIYRYLEHPLNLNSATPEEMERLHLLTDFQILSLQDYIRENGPLLSIYELPLVYGFDESLARTLQPFVTFGSLQRAVPKKPGSSHDLLVFSSAVLETQKGYASPTDTGSGPSAGYSGNRIRLMTKYNYKWGDKLVAGYKGDKDPGEPMFRAGNQQGFDFNSAYVQVNNVRKFSRIIAGDYLVRSGQGLLLWSGLAFGKSPDIINIRRKGDVLKHYSSVDENRFLRGVSATAEAGRFDLTGFISYKKIDANILENTLTGVSTFSSFQTSGYHRTAGEMEDRDAVSETVAGAVIQWNAERLRLGATILHYRFNPAYVRETEVSFNTNLGADYHLVLKRLSFFGEIAYSSNSSSPFRDQPWGILNGANLQLHPKVYLSLLQRFMGSAYYAQYGNAFRENSQNTNENGIYMGIELMPVPKWKFSAYLDTYRFPYLASLFAERNSGYDYHVQAEFTHSDRLSTYLRYRYKKKPENVNSGSGNDPSVPEPSGSQLRFHISCRINPSLTFQDRLEYSRYTQSGTEHGWLAYHDILFRPAGFPVDFSFRYAMFDTESYDTRIYTYEHDVLYYFAIPSWSGRGIRTYLNVRTDIGRHLDLWLKYSLSWYPDRETLGSGLNEIPGSHRQDIHLQMRLKF